MSAPSKAWYREDGSLTSPATISTPRCCKALAAGESTLRLTPRTLKEEDDDDERKVLTTEPPWPPRAPRTTIVLNSFGIHGHAEDDDDDFLVIVD